MAMARRMPTLTMPVGCWVHGVRRASSSRIASAVQCPSFDRAGAVDPSARSMIPSGAEEPISY